MATPKPRTTTNRFYTAKSYRTEESVGFLLGRCLNHLTDAIDESLLDLGITSQQFGVLHAIFKGTVKNPSELARLRFQNSAAITYTLDVLEEKKLLVRKRSAQDRRVVELELTTEGTKLTEICIPIVVEAQNVALSNLRVEDYQTLASLLRRITAPREARVLKKTRVA